jgi:hypothetical protein
MDPRLRGDDELGLRNDVKNQALVNTAAVNFVIPAHAGTHGDDEPAAATIINQAASTGPRFRRDDEG